MRIVFTSVSDQVGGSESMLLQIISELRRVSPSWDLHLVLPGLGPLATRAAALGVSIVPLPMPAGLARLGEWGMSGRGKVAVASRLLRAALALPGYERRLQRVLASIQPDVIHANGFKAQIVAARAGVGQGGLVWHIHEYVGDRPLTRILVRRYAGRCRAIVANSESVGDDVRRIVGPRDTVRVILNAVDLEKFSPGGPVADLDALSGLPPAPDGTVRIGLIATFSRWKGHDTFLRAIAALSDAARVRGYVVGGATYDTEGSQYSIEELRRLAASVGLENRVGFTGLVADPERVMRALDVVVHASTTPEPFGLVIAEAMACGRAVITSGTGGAAELVSDGEDAVVHRAGDAADLAARMTRLATDGALRARLGLAARATALKRFDARRLGEEFAATYRTARIPA
ncbi:MAG: glycosyltransferase family 4 protein [Acidobacteriota bacterium]